MKTESFPVPIPLPPFLCPKLRCPTPGRAAGVFTQSVNAVLLSRCLHRYDLASGSFHALITASPAGASRTEDWLKPLRHGPRLRRHSFHEPSSMNSPIIRHSRPPAVAAFAFALVALALAGSTLLAADASSEKLSPDQLAFFEKKIRPVLVTKCYQCHSAESEKVKGGLLLDTREGIRRGGATGHGVTPRDLKDSLVIKAIRGDIKDGLMPPKEKLPADVIADFEKWVLMGAPDPRDGSSKLAGKKPDLAEAKKFWSFQPPAKTPVPAVKNAAWPKTDIDRFILAALEAKGLRPVADADRVTLLRRVTFDLVGLPPTPEQVRAFSTADSPRALEKIVDELLASPQFGERWGRHWLDIARYAESTGKERNYAYPQAWRYRDYVIAALNADKPYDQFLREQIAGDLLPAKDTAQRNELLIATGFLALGPKGLNERNREAFVMEMVDEQIDATTRATIGLTVSCARCHDHKFDPISTRDYYALAGIFKSSHTYYGTGGGEANKNRQPSTLMPLVKSLTPAAAPAVVAAKPIADIDEATAPEASAITASPKTLTPAMKAELLAMTKKNPKLVARLKSMSDEQKIALIERRGETLPAVKPAQAAKAAKAQKAAKKKGDGVQSAAKASTGGEPSGELVMGVLEGRAADCPIYLRGELDEKGPVIPRGFVSVLASAAVPKINPAHSGRLELAQWLTSRDNPLTARVMANRVWQHLFGQGLVRTPDNFGATGERPTHPELLDYLAHQVMDQQWSLKRLVRAVVLSRAYQLSATGDATNFAADPDNHLLWHATQRRLDAEAIRDAALAVSGQLDLAPPHGSPVTALGEGDIGRGNARGALKAESRKRSVYLPIVRDLVPDILDLFDFAEPSLVVAERDVTNVPSQALFMLNSPFIYNQSAALAQFLQAEPDSSRRITTAYLRTLARLPTPAEQQRAGQFIAKLTATPGSKAATAWTTFTQALLASAEFRFLN